MCVFECHMIIIIDLVVWCSRWESNPLSGICHRPRLYDRAASDYTSPWLNHSPSGALFCRTVSTCTRYQRGGKMLTGLMIKLRLTSQTPPLVAGCTMRIVRLDLFIVFSAYHLEALHLHPHSWICPIDDKSIHRKELKQ